MKKIIIALFLFTSLTLCYAEKAKTPPLAVTSGYSFLSGSLGARVDYTFPGGITIGLSGSYGPLEDFTIYNTPVFTLESYNNITAALSGGYTFRFLKRAHFLLALNAGVMLHSEKGWVRHETYDIDYEYDYSYPAYFGALFGKVGWRFFEWLGLEVYGQLPLGLLSNDGVIEGKSRSFLDYGVGISLYF